MDAKGRITSASNVTITATLPAFNSLTLADPAFADVVAGCQSGTNKSFEVDRLLGLARYNPGGRLTVTSGQPIADNASAVSTIYYTPYVHDLITLWDGTRWQTVTFTEQSITISGTHNIFNCGCDVFAYLSSGALAIELTLWGSATARGTAVSYQDGRLCKFGDKTRLLLGSYLSLASTGTTIDGPLNRRLSNIYNTVPRSMSVIDSTSHSYSGTTRQWRGLTTNNLTFFMSYFPLTFSVTAKEQATCPATVYGIVSCGVDSASTETDSDIAYLENTGSSGEASACTTFPVALTAVGLHTIYLLQRTASGTVTFLFGRLSGIIQN